MEILKLKPVFKDYLWGGNNLKTVWNKKSDKETIAESWELSTHKDGKSGICGEKYGVNTLEDILTKEMIGNNGKKYDRFPLLIKFIDAKDNLSIQVHPDDDYAIRHENDYGKTEMWYICDCEKNSGIYLGFKENTARDKVKKAVRNNNITDLLNFIPVAKGDSFLINAGTIHAVCKGVTICEIQQNSNITYRIYDYGRTDKNGRKRELHIEKALDIIDYNRYQMSQKNSDTLAECKYFTVKKYIVKDSALFECNKESFNAVNIIEGSGTIDDIGFIKGDTFFIPAGYGSYKINGNAEILITNIN